MEKTFLLLFLCFSTIGFAQFMQEHHFYSKKDTFFHQKNINYTKQRSFKEDLKNKYSDKDFQYKEDVEDIKNENTSSSSGLALANGIVYFMKTFFPFILGGIIIFILLKTFLGTEINFWNFKKQENEVAKKLIYEDEDIYETDIDRLLEKAIINKEYRLAIRYYYLSALKNLSTKKIIDYHKDKTNSEYLFEIENSKIKAKFSYLSYIYTYVWYGKFPIDETNFKLVENKYQSFKTFLK